MIARAHTLQWVAPTPLWSGSPAPDRIAAQRPALLRFDNDAFMEQLIGLLGSDAATLKDKVATPASFRERPTGAPASWRAVDATTPLKLYQSTHGHFNLVAASLICRLPGLPDHAAEGREQVGFVLRRRGSDGREFAWSTDTGAGAGAGTGSGAGAASAARIWTAVGGAHGAGADALSPGEEVFPLFALGFAERGRMRRLLAGLIPVASRESFRATPVLGDLNPVAAWEPDPAHPGQAIDTRLDELTKRVSEPLQAILDADAAGLDTDNGEASLFVVLDLYEVLGKYLPQVRERILAGSPGSLSGQALALYNALGVSVGGGAATWRDALRHADSDWPAITGEAAGDPALVYDLRHSALTPATLVARVQAALGPFVAPTTLPPPVDAAGLPTAPPQVPKIDTRDTDYVVRCVLRRPPCKPPHPDVVSPPSLPFRLAGYFDGDAPARPIRIPMPVETSIAGLRRAKKNVGIILSDQLRKQMSKVKDGKKALDGELGGGTEFQLGEICSLSIPIITLCAMIVLMIFISLLNIVFWWMPLLRICLPIPLIAKKPKG